jgi:hypothetical protein
VFDLSPILSVVVIGLAVFPERLSFLTERDDWPSTATRVILFVLPALWMVNVFVGPRSVMIDNLSFQLLATIEADPIISGTVAVITLAAGFIVYTYRNRLE